MRARAALFAAAALAGAAIAALAGPAARPAAAEPATRLPLEERLLTGSAQDEVPITATFSGSEIFVYGAIARNRFLAADEPPPDLAIVVQGPTAPVLVRKKSRVAGVFMNTETVRIAEAPSFYAVASTKPLNEMLRSDQDLVHRISLDRAVLIAGLPYSSADPEAFRRALIRLRRRAGLYRLHPNRVTLTAGTLFQAKVRLPADIHEGDYKIRVFLARENRVIDRATRTLPVAKQGLERVIFTAAQDRPLVYGVLTLLVGLLAGWGASELFRRLGR
ncbi:MAG: TIGR02186 family protein [Pseudomonadota bacterium]